MASPSNERAALAPLLLFLALFVARCAKTGAPTYGFLLWNLMLASVPVLLAVGAAAAVRARRRMAALVMLGGWFVFLPNAPYVITDFVHLRHRDAPLWFDVALLGSAALAGLACGTASLARVHAALRSAGVSARGAVALLVGACFASGYGIYLGRFARLNSWDLALHPGDVLMDALPPLLSPLDHPRAWAVTLVFGALIATGYVSTLLAAPAREPQT